MQNSQTTSMSNLRTLLEGLYPDVYISTTGLALLAAQIGNGENKREPVPTPINYPHPVLLEDTGRRGFVILRKPTAQQST
jgi:hypothetical protein